jgi:hypothetical protein
LEECGYGVLVGGGMGVGEEREFVHFVHQAFVYEEEEVVFVE